MIESDHTRIVRWLRQVLTSAEQPDRVLIHHVTIDDRQTEISAVGLQGFVAAEESLLALGEDLERTIQADATGLGGIQRYLIVACLGDALISRLPIRQVAGEVRIGDPVNSEPATPQGLLSQLMRHNEAQARLFAGAMGQIVGNMGETIERQRVEIDKTDAIRIEALQRVEDLISNDHQRKLEMTKETNRAAKVQQLVGFAFDMAPTIANRVMGKPIFKEVARNPTKSLVKRFLASITDEQRETMFGSLSKVQLAVLRELIDSTADEPVEEKPRGPTSGPATSQPAAPTEGEPEAPEGRPTPEVAP